MEYIREKLARAADTEHSNWRICVRAARPSRRARCGAGAGCSAIKYLSFLGRRGLGPAPAKLFLAPALNPKPYTLERIFIELVSWDRQLQALRARNFTEPETRPPEPDAASRMEEQQSGLQIRVGPPSEACFRSPNSDKPPTKIEPQHKPPTLINPQPQ